MNPTKGRLKYGASFVSLRSFIEAELRFGVYGEQGRLYFERRTHDQNFVRTI
jgi:hypothetical protein